MVITMSQLHFYVPDEIETQIRHKAQQANLPLSRYLAEIVKRETSQKNQWPEGYFELFGSWEGTPLVRSPQLPLEERMGFD
jgi:hypothetical protein